MNKKRLLSILFLSCMPVACLWPCIQAQADIYRYVDSKGIIHFTNVPTTPGYYSVYIRETPRSHPGSGLYEGDIAAAARRHGISTSLIKAVIRAESNFNPHAVSRAGACGLMQIMPKTAEDLGIADPFDPRENIFGGARYLSELLTQFDGDLPLALAAYNAGPNKVGSRKEVPQIPETQRFVRTVLRYLERY